MVHRLICQSWKPPLLLGATALCLALSAPHAEAACSNPPVIGWPEGKVPALTRQTPDSLEIQYHDQCSGENSTHVNFRRVGFRSFFTPPGRKLRITVFKLAPAEAACPRRPAISYLAASDWTKMTRRRADPTCA